VLSSASYNHALFVCFRHTLDKLDWTRQHGHRLGGRDSEEPYEPEGAIDQGAYRLGGDTERANSRPLRELAFEAATLRLTAEEQEISDGCGGPGPALK